MATILQTIAQDLNRTLLHGSRQASADGQVLPSTVLDGRQGITTVEQLTNGVELIYQDGTVANLIPDADHASVQKTHDAVNEALSHPDPFFQVEDEKQIPTWLYHQKLFSVPTKPTPENVLIIEDRKLLRLPAAVLHEAASKVGSDDSAPEPVPISLCKVVTRKRENASFQSLEPLARNEWQVALILRCPVDPAWDAEGVVRLPVFELAGIPQNERWYLDRLGLLKPGHLNQSLPANSELRVWIERPPEPNRTVPVRQQVKQWVIARRNLTGLARPDQESIAEEVGEDAYPYAVNEENKEDTLRLAQMGSITNSGGYYLRTHQVGGDAANGIAEGDLSFPFARHTLIFVVLFPNTPASEDPGALQLPPHANAVIFKKKPDPFDPANPVEPTVVRFEGLKHVVVEPYAQPGCISFGWRRPLPAIVTDEDKFPTSEVGFARSIHLLDYEIANANGGLISQWQEKKVEWTQDANLPGGWKRTSEWGTVPCSGNTGPALSPVKPLPGQDDHNQPIAALRMDLPLAESNEHAEDEAPNPYLYYYRATIRFTPEAGGYAYLSDPSLRKLTIRPGLRDIFGNRLQRDLPPQTKTLYYTDALISPAEWPGFEFRLFPSAAGEVMLESRYKKPPGAKDGFGTDAQEFLRKLVRARAQLSGTSNDVVLKIQAPAFEFTAVPGHVGLKETLAALLDLAITSFEPPPPPENHQPLPPETGVDYCRFAVTFSQDVTDMNQPYLFSPTLTIARANDNYLPKDLYPSDPDLKSAIESQISRASTLLALAPKATDPTSGKPAAFREVAEAFARLIAPRIHCQAAMRRNRFDELELWFAPDAIFPTVSNAPPVFSTARPLDNHLGAQTFPLPDFAIPTDVQKWRDFPMQSASVTRVDFDDLGRRVFNLLEELASPFALTGRELNPDNPKKTLLWGDIMAAKDRVAKYLGDTNNGYVVPFFTETKDVIQPAGVTRMSQDAFQHDLRLFYGIDALVQWPVDLKPVDKITNFYGKSQSEISPAGGPQPQYSDFVLSVSADGGSNKQPGRLTVTYNLPPGDEDKFENWTTNSFKAQITHLQLWAPDTPKVFIFDQGEWLELVTLADSAAVTALEYRTPVTVPAALRKFPHEPSIHATQPLTVVSGFENPPSPEPNELTAWGWRLEIDTDDQDPDLLYVDVEYNGPEIPSSRSASPQGEGDDWKAVSLLHALVILGRLADRPKSWWDGTNGQKALEAMPFLLGNLLRQLRPKEGPLADAEPSLQIDSFTIPVGNPGEINVGEHNWVREVEASLEHSGDVPDHHLPLGVVRLTIAPKKNQGKWIAPLNLFGKKAAWNYRPSVSLKRNSRILGREDVSASLIYECGPVYFPNFVPVANRWMGAVMIPRPPTNSTLAKVLEGVLVEIFGPDTDLRQFVLRLDCKHAFNVGEHLAINPFHIFPTDYKYTDANATATAVANSYATWLGTAPSADLLKTIDQPSFHLGLQVAREDTKVHRALLEVEALSIDSQLAPP